jgi:heptosyltransferase III
VLLSGPAVRAASRTAGSVVFLAGPNGAEAARLLPGVDDVVVFDAPWVSFEPPATDASALSALIASISEHAIDEALILTSFHQSPLPLAMLLRLAGVDRIGATCVDYPGSLLDVRLPYREDLHEVEQALALCTAMGHELPDSDDAALAIELPVRTGADPWPSDRYVVVHPGASVPARSLPAKTTRDVVRTLVGSGRCVVVTGSRNEVDLARAVVPASVSDRVCIVAGTTSFVDTAHIVAGADAVLCGNTGIAHLAAAVQTPVIDVFAPVVAPHRWRPWRVPHVLLGQLDIDCAGCRSRTCPLPGQPCLASYTPAAVIDALHDLDRHRRASELCEAAG